MFQKAIHLIHAMPPSDEWHTSTTLYVELQSHSTSGSALIIALDKCYRILFYSINALQCPTLKVYNNI